MTIGPAPMIRIDFMSVRLGMDELEAYRKLGPRSKRGKGIREMEAIKDTSSRALFSKFAMQMTIFAAMLFVPAGTIRWWQGWVYLVLSLLIGIAGAAWLRRANPDLLKERLKPLLQQDQPRADKIATLLFVGASSVWFMFIPYDVFHLHLLPAPPMGLRWLGLVLWAVSLDLFYLTFRENSFAAPVVKHQADRHQAVIDTGPYAVVRHPLYAAALIYALAIPLWLGSTAGMLLVLVPLVFLVIRIRIEEAFLAEHLPGYRAYLEKLPWRVVPHVW
jgi:protein-S-isoprenylcysteine O-methyltransferase Ste14